MRKRPPLPVGRSMNLTEAAHEQLRQLCKRYGLSNTYSWVVLLERLDDYMGHERLDQVFHDFITGYGAPASQGER